ncbi:MAG: hypothetical protein ACK5LN_14775 [Propioniciclava sp.]
MTGLLLMPSSTAGRPISVLLGNAGDIDERGAQLTELGQAMVDSWRLISQLVDDGAAMDGEAIDKLREIAGTVSSDLNKAGESYLAVGPRIREYAEELSWAQQRIDPLVQDLQDLWEKYLALERDAAEAAASENADSADPSTAGTPSNATTEAEAAAQAARDKRAEWDEKAGEYDDAWDTWHDAFMTAANGIKEDFTDGLDDSWKDDLRGTLDFLADALAVAGIVLAVLAIVVGGPLIMALAAVVAVATLMVQLAKFGVGDGNGVDLFFAVVGVVPFIGPAAKFLRSGNIGAQFTADGARLFGRGATSFRSWFSGVNTLGGSGFWGGAQKFSAQFFTGKSADEWLNIGSRGIDAIDTLATVWSTQIGITSMIKSTLGDNVGSGLFDPDQHPFENPFRHAASDPIMAPGPPGEPASLYETA